ncbi:MAG: cryptochrome/photolyase family protein [Phycisphaeraceae bacterium]
MTSSSNHPPALHIILGNQLFPPSQLPEDPAITFFMAEDNGLCTYVKHHKKKIILFLAAMRCYADQLRDRNLPLIYERLNDPNPNDRSYEDKLEAALRKTKAKRLITWEIEDKFFEQRIHTFADDHNLELETHPSPMFLTTREQFADYLKNTRKPFMATFYQQQRKRLDILIDDDNKPAGGKWSFDEDNRKKLPKDITPPDITPPEEKQHIADIRDLVRERFADHPGDDTTLLFPVTRRQALAALDKFLAERFHLFGDYEDALSTRHDTLFHSLLSPAMNLGLITPREIIDRAIAAANDHDIPLNALEGFIRQIIGWREFIRGIYQNFSEKQDTENFFNHDRRLTQAWYDGTTGIPPLDHAINKAHRLGYAHHIERLMVLANLMNLARIHPHETHRWFMEMFVDASDWVMGPNVYGMGLFSDGGVFSTKPYICGSNYLLKMSDHKKGPWCDTVDGLYWSFIDRHRDFFSSNPRLNMMTRTLDKMKLDRKKHIFKAAESFIDKHTLPPK